MDEPGNDTTPKRSLVDRGRGAVTWGQRQQAKLEAARPAHDSVEVGFRWLQRDKEIAGGVLGGGLAYRFFFWALAFTLFFAGGLGIARHSGEDVAGAARDTGIGGTVARSIADASEQSESGRWWLLALGAWLLLWFSMGLLKALRLVHAASWRIVAPPQKRYPLALFCVVLGPILVLAINAGAGWIRAHSGSGTGLVATLSVTFAYIAIWVLASRALPSRADTWKAFVPGAIFFALALQAIHVVSVYYLAEKLGRQSELYGSLGLAATALFALFLFGRSVVWAAELNAVTWELRQPDH